MNASDRAPRLRYWRIRIGTFQAGLEVRRQERDGLQPEATHCFQAIAWGRTEEGSDDVPEEHRIVAAGLVG